MEKNPSTSIEQEDTQLPWLYASPIEIGDVQTQRTDFETAKLSYLDIIAFNINNNNNYNGNGNNNNNNSNYNGNSNNNNATV